MLKVSGVEGAQQICDIIEDIIHIGKIPTEWKKSSIVSTRARAARKSSRPQIARPDHKVSREGDGELPTTTSAHPWHTLWLHAWTHSLYASYKKSSMHQNTVHGLRQPTPLTGKLRVVDLEFAVRLDSPLYVYIYIYMVMMMVNVLAMIMVMVMVMVVMIHVPTHCRWWWWIFEVRWRLWRRIRQMLPWSIKLQKHCIFTHKR